MSPKPDADDVLIILEDAGEDRRELGRQAMKVRLRKITLSQAMTLILEGKPLADWPPERCRRCLKSLLVHDGTPCDAIPRCECGRAMGSLCNGCGRFVEGRIIERDSGHNHALPAECARCYRAAEGGAA